MIVKYIMSLIQKSNVLMGNVETEQAKRPASAIQTSIKDSSAVAAMAPELERAFRGHKKGVTCVDMVPGMMQCVSGSQDGLVFVWPFKYQLRPYRFSGHGGIVFDVAASPSGRQIASASADKTIRIWNNSSRGECAVIHAHTATVRSVKWSSNERMLLTASDDKVVKIWDADERKFKSSLTGHTNWVRSADFSPNEKFFSQCSSLVVSGGDDRTVKVWDVERSGNDGKNNSVIHTFYDHSDIVSCTTFHPDGACVAACSHDRSIKLWDLRSRRLLQHYQAHDSPVSCISIHPSGNFLISAGSKDQSIRLWDLREGRLLYSMTGHSAATTSCRFAHGDEGQRFFITGGLDSTVLVWKADLVDNFNKSGILGDEVGDERFTKRRDKASLSPLAKSRRKPLHRAATSSPSKHTDDQLASQIDPSLLDARVVNMTNEDVETNNNVVKTSVTTVIAPEVSDEFGTTDKRLARISTQLDLVLHTVQLLERRIQLAESRIEKVEKFATEN